MTNNNLSREDLISRVIAQSKKSNNIALQWATGLGKSRAALEIASFRKSLQGDKPFRILLLVAEVAHKENWIEEIKKWNKEDLVKDLIIECYHSLHNYTKHSFDMIILDEGHHSGSENRLSSLATIKATYITVLSATLKELHLKSLSELFGKFIVDSINLNTAIDLGYLPQPKIYLIKLKLEDIFSECIIIEEWGKKEKRETIYCSYNERWKYLTNKKVYVNTTLVIKCTAIEKYQYLSNSFDYYRKLYFRTNKDFAKIKWLKCGLDRKLFLGELKTSSAKKLIHKVKNKRFICFCTNIEQAEILGGKNSIHSEKKNSLEILKAFNNKEINSLFAVGMLQEGQNLVDIDLGIIIQLDSEERSFIQKSGRSMRAKEPIQYILYFENTRDEEVLIKNVLNELSPDYICTISNINEI